MTNFMLQKRKMQRIRLESEELQNMINSFRVSDLQTLLGSVGKNRSGRKNELQLRAVDILRSCPRDINAESFRKRIREIFKAAQDEAKQVNNAEMQQMHPNMQMQQLGNSMPQGMHHQQYAHQQRAVGNPPPYNYQHQQNASNVRNFNYQYHPPNSASMQHHKQRSGMLEQPPHVYGYPQVVPGVSIKKLTFYRILDTILQPTSLVPTGPPTLSQNTPKLPNMQECAITFRLSSEMASEIALNRDISNDKNEYVVQLQLRFCAYEPNGGEYDDFLPLGLYVRLCGRYCALPPALLIQNRSPSEARRLPRPVNVSCNAKLCPNVVNTLVINWTPDVEKKNYSVALYVVRKMTSEHLLDEVNTNAKIPADVTKQMIMKKLEVSVADDDDDDDCATTMLYFSLMCPLGASKLVYPAKGKSCVHLQCFDARNYIFLNEKRPNWVCPCCHNPLPFEDIQIFQYIIDILESKDLPADCRKVQFMADGTWKACDLDEEENKCDAKSDGQADCVEMIVDDLDDDDSDNGSTSDAVTTPTEQSKNVEPSKINETVDLTEEDDVNDNDEKSSNEDDCDTVSSATARIDQITITNGIDVDSTTTNGEADSVNAGAIPTKVS